MTDTISWEEFERALQQIRADQARAARKRRRQTLCEKKEAERRLQVAIWIGRYLQENRVSPPRVRR